MVALCPRGIWVPERGRPVTRLGRQPGAQAPSASSPCSVKRQPWEPPRLVSGHERAQDADTRHSAALPYGLAQRYVAMQDPSHGTGGDSKR